MHEELLPYYHRELAFIRRLGADFAATYPKIAARLRLDPRSGETEDPHVERLLEGFAYLNARIRHKLDDDFPEIAEAMLGVLYPHYLVPIPSMAIVGLQLDRGQGELTAGYAVPAGTALEADAPDGVPCRFRTVYPVTLWPIEVVSAELCGPPFTAPPPGDAARAQALLRIELRAISTSVSIAQLEVPALRFFLKGQGQYVFPLYELLLRHAVSVVVADSARDPEPTRLGPECLQPVGFEREEGALPYPPRSFLGYRLLTEFFAFPQKFLFVEVNGLGPALCQRKGRTAELRIYLDRAAPEMEPHVTPDTFRLGATPIVNLFTQRAEPIALTHTEAEYRVVPDARHPEAHEIYSIDRVTATSPDNQQVEYQPFYSFKHAADREAHKRFWHAVRRPAASAGGQAGSDVYLMLVDLGFSPAAPPQWTLDVETTCLDGDRPRQVLGGEGRSFLRLVRGAPIARIECLTEPTRVLRPAARRGVLWRLISHLALNHLSLAGNAGEGVAALREILALYDFAESPETQSMIQGLCNVRARRVVGRSRGPGGGVCRGLEVTIELDEERFVGSGMYLFASVLERFLGLYASINSFSKLVAVSRKGETLWQWPPRAGETVLL